MIIEETENGCVIKIDGKKYIVHISVEVPIVTKSTIGLTVADIVEDKIFRNILEAFQEESDV